jgi:hypothetical protein
MPEISEIRLDREKRDALLRPYLNRLAGLEQHRDAEGLATTIHVGARTIRIDAWEREQILEHLNTTGSGEREALLAEGVAFQTRTLVDLGSAEPDPDSPDLLLDAALGLKMMEETQSAINQMVLSGQIEDARQLTRFRNKIGSVLQDLKQAIGEQHTVEAAAIAEITPAEPPPIPMNRTPSHREETTDDVVSDLVKSVEKAADARNTVRSVRRSKARPVVWALTVILVAVGAVSMITQDQPVLLEPLQPVDFAATPEITYAQCIPPSILTRVEFRVWQKLGDEGRYRLAENVSRIASVAGYSGVQISDYQGTVLAQWLRNEGIRILVPSPQPAPE